MTTASEAIIATEKLGFTVVAKGQGYMVANADDSISPFYVRNAFDLIEWAEVVVDNASYGMFKGE